MGQPELKRRAEAIGQTVDGLRESGVAGSPAEVVDKIGRLARFGCERIYLRAYDLSDLDQIELLAADVMPQV